MDIDRGGHGVTLSLGWGTSQGCADDINLDRAKLPHQFREQGVKRRLYRQLGADCLCGVMPGSRALDFIHQRIIA